MARNGTGRLLRRRTARRDDRISTLSDDLLLLILCRLDTRTALGAGLLSRRWAHLPRELPALNFSVGDILPVRYRKLLHRDIKGTFLDYRSKLELKSNIGRYERRAMRSLTSSIESFLDAANNDRAHRRVSKLRLEFFTTHNTNSMNRLITEAIDAWGVDDLEAAAKPTYQKRDVHTFPVHGLCKEPRASRLRNLKLGGCVLPPLHEYSALTVLVLQGIPESPVAAYEGVFSSCPQLQTLHFISCRCTRDRILVADAPSSKIRELVVDKCRFDGCP